MRILALDSSGLVAGVAVLESENEKKDAQTIAEYTVNYKKTHSQTLLPMLDEIVKMTELDLDTIDAIAIASGPGSFTGLRIGSATAKGLGLALKKPIGRSADTGRTGIQSLRYRRTDLSNHGREKRAGLYRYLCMCR